MSSESRQRWDEWTSGLAPEAKEALERYVTDSLEGTIEAIFLVVEKRDPLLAAHCRRVERYSSLIGQAMALSDNDLRLLHYAALLHDNGKLCLPEAILWKHTAPRAEEQALLEGHAMLTYELLKPIRFNPSLGELPFIASSHHEYLDGSGYPRKLRGEEIPLIARIVVVANLFDELTSIRNFRERVPIAQVDQTFAERREKQLDVRVVDALYDLGSDRILKIMTSESGVEQSDFSAFKSLTWKELMCICRQSSADNEMVEAFHRVYGSQPVLTG